MSSCVSRQEKGYGDGGRRGGQEGVAHSPPHWDPVAAKHSTAGETHCRGGRRARVMGGSLG